MGAGNYAAMLHDPVFFQALRNNAVYAAATIPISVVLALAMALAVNRAIPGRAALRMAFFLPTMLPLIAVANIWLFFYTPDYGLLDQVLGAFGFGRHNWLGDPALALPSLIAVATWKEAGFFMIFYLAALQTLPPVLQEAGRLEGAAAAILLPPGHPAVTHAHHAVRTRQRRGKRVPPGRPCGRHDARRP